MTDVARAAAYTWLIVSTVLFTAAALPFVVPADALFAIAPVCEARRQGGSCLLCGMTTAYAAIGDTRFADARQANRGAVPLWAASLANFCIVVPYLSKALRTRHGR
jgi:hypothetical protein